jgi:hypothetical protein
VAHLSRSKMLSAPDLLDLIGLRSERSRRPGDSAQGLIAGRTLRRSKPARDVAAEWGLPRGWDGAQAARW